MSTARRVASRLGLVIAAAMIAAAASAQERANHFGLSFPAEIGGFTFSETHDFEKEKPGLGYSVSYGRPGWLVNVYIYDLGFTSIPEGARFERIRAQFEQAEGDIFRAQQKGQYKNAVLRARFEVADAKGDDRLVCGTFRVRRPNDSKDADSYLCVSGWKNKFVKFRMTALIGAGNDATARLFLQAWAKKLWS